MSDPIFILLLFIVGPASICITTILGYLAFLHITKRYAVQASNNVFDRMFDMLERKLPDIVEKFILSRREPVQPIKTEDLTQRFTEGKELLSKLLGAFDIGGNMGEDLSTPERRVDEQPTLKSRPNRVILDVE